MKVAPIPGESPYIAHSSPAEESKQIKSLRRKLERHLSDFDQAATDEKIEDAKARFEGTLSKQSETRVTLKEHSVAEWNRPTKDLYDKIARELGGK